MAEFFNEFGQENPTERVIHSRKNTPEERRKQRREWKKKKQEKSMSKSIVVQQEGDDFAAHVSETVGKHISPKTQTSAPGNAKKPRFETDERGNEERKMNMQACSRGAKMVKMAVGKDPRVTLQQEPRRKFIAKQTTVNVDSKFEAKELKREHLEYSSENPVGCGSFGQCFHGRYRGIEVIVKQMIHSNTLEDQERARKNLLHEAKILSSLGDHPNLPMIFGVVTKSLPFCLVTQFHGVKEASLTLHQAANTNMLTPTSCMSIFKKICFALSQVHLKGYLHNDLKANNVVLERARVSDEFNPVVIDFGKSVMASSVQAYGKVNELERSTKHYLAPEVRIERRYSVASDIYSLGRMLKAISCTVGFYQRVRTLVKEATKERPSERPSLEVFTNTVSELRF